MGSVLMVGAVVSAWIQGKAHLERTCPAKALEGAGQRKCPVIQVWMWKVAPGKRVRGLRDEGALPAGRP